MNTELTRTRGAAFGPVLVAGFGATLAMACTWFVTHLPWLAMPEQVAIPLIIAAWLLAIAAITANMSRGRSINVGLGAGFVSGLTGLVFFGSKIVPPANAASVSEWLAANAWLLATRAAGFVTLGIVVGFVGGLMGRIIAREQEPDLAAPHWLSRFSLVACAAIAPLIFIGGLVTSTNSGMAVPDWPETFGANMFLYPLGGHLAADLAEEISKPDSAAKTYAQVYLEHSHRLFGAFAGLTGFVLLVFTLIVERRRRICWIAVTAFLLICIQGYLGGQRVHVQAILHDDPVKGARIGRLLAFAHGILAQLTFGTLVGLAVTLSNHFRAVSPGQILLDPRLARRIRILCTATLHCLILQLILGAIYRHFRGNHALWTHIGFSVIVATLAVIAGFTLTGEPVRRTLVGKRVSTIGLALGCVAGLQFFLGWLAFAFAGRDPSAEDIGQALIRTVHQANGAVLLAVATAAFIWGRRLGRARPVAA